MKKFLDWIENRLGILWKKAEYSSDNDTQSLSVIRILYGLFILLFATPSFSWIGKIPQGFFLPPFLSLGNLFDSFPNYSWLLAIDVILLLLTICIILGIKTRYAGILFAVFYVIGYSFRISFGKIDHGEIMFIAFIFGLSFTNWGTVNALVPDRKVSPVVQRKTLAILAGILCFAMFTAGFEKALRWIDLDLETGGFLSWFYSGFFNLNRHYFLAPFVLSVPPQFFEIFDYFAVAFELSPLIALLSGRKWWHLWLFVAAMFHLGNTLLLNIPFTNHALVYLSFVSVSSFFKGFQFKRDRAKLVLFILTIIGVIATHSFYQLYVNQAVESISIYVLPIFKNERELYLYTGLLIWFLTTYIMGRSVKKLFSVEVKK